MPFEMSITKGISYFVTAALGKLPLVYLMMLMWSGLVVGFTGQAIMFLTYTVVMLLAYAVVRPVLASTTTPESMGFLYSLFSPIDKSQGMIDSLVGVFMGVPSEFVSSLTGNITSWAQRYILLGLPDVMIFPSAFMWGYGITTAEHGLTDGKNMPMLFTTILSILLQLNITQMGGTVAFLNTILGIFLGVLGGSLVESNPDLSPFSKGNQSFNVVVSNLS